MKDEDRGAPGTAEGLRLERLAQARGRLSRAVDEVEKLIAERAARRPPPAPPDRTARLAELEAENARLRQATATVSTRLNATILRLRSLLQD